MLNSGPSRRRGWILRHRKLAHRVSRGPYALWDPIFGHVGGPKKGRQDIPPTSNMKKIRAGLGLEIS